MHNVNFICYVYEKANRIHIAILIAFVGMIHSVRPPRKKTDCLYSWRSFGTKKNPSTPSKHGRTIMFYFEMIDTKIPGRGAYIGREVFRYFGMQILIQTQ